MPALHLFLSYNSPRGLDTRPAHVGRRCGPWRSRRGAQELRGAVAERGRHASLHARCGAGCRRGNQAGQNPLEQIGAVRIA